MTSVSLIVEQFPYAGLFILLILGGIGLPFPEDATLILCGFLISHKIIRPVPALLVIYSGLLIADFMLYSFGAKYGRKIFTHKKFGKIISSERLSKLEDGFSKKGVFFVLLGRHLIGLRAQIFIAAGIMRMSKAKFLLADAVSSLFTIAVMTGAGYIGGNSMQVIRKDIARVEHVAIFLLVVIMIAYLLFRYFGSRNNKSSP